MVRPEREPEHVGDDLVSEALRLELVHQIDEDLGCRVSERRAGSGGGGELGNQHRRLANDRVDEQVDVHPAVLAAKRVAP